MSWWSDKEKFDEYDPPQCEFCKRGNSYEECERSCDHSVLTIKEMAFAADHQPCQYEYRHEFEKCF